MAPRVPRVKNALLSASPTAASAEREHVGAHHVVEEAGRGGPERGAATPPEAQHAHDRADRANPEGLDRALHQGRVLAGGRQAEPEQQDVRTESDGPPMIASSAASWMVRQHQNVGFVPMRSAAIEEDPARDGTGTQDRQTKDRARSVTP